MLKFFYNGIKDNGGKLQTVYYSLGNLTNYPADTITIYNREYSRFSNGIHAAFTVENDSEMQTDYFEKDRIRVLSSHPLYPRVLAAMNACKAKMEARHAARMARVSGHDQQAAA